MKSKKERYSNQGKKDITDNGELRPLKAQCPKKLYELLEKRADELGLPLSKLVFFAIDNELETNNPFFYDLEMPDIEYNEGDYLEEAQKIYDYLQKWPGGLGLDALVYSRHNYGIDSKVKVMLGFRELLERDLIEGFYPSRALHRYPKDYLYYRKKGIQLSKKSKHRKRLGQKMKPNELKRFLEHYGISDADFAEVLGISEQAIKSWLSSKRKISPVVAKLVRFFNKHPEMILEF